MLVKTLLNPEDLANKHSNMWMILSIFLSYLELVPLCAQVKICNNLCMPR